MLSKIKIGKELDMMESSQKIPTKEKMKKEEKIAFIEEKIKAGYTPYEIVESDPTKSIELSEVLKQIDKMLSEDLISQKEIDVSRQKFHKGKKPKTHPEIVEIIKEYTKLGYNYREIAAALDYNYNHIISIKNTYAVPHSWFTREEIREFRRQRIEREYQSLSQEEKDRLIQEKESKEMSERQKKRMEKSQEFQKRRAKVLEKHQKDIKKIKKYIAKGYTITETAELLKMRREQVYTLRKESQINGTWFSPKEIEKLRQKGIDIASKETRRKQYK